MNLYKSKDKKISGVCGGIAEHFGLNKTIVRVTAALLCVRWPYALLIYMVLTIVLPEKFEDAQYSDGARANQSYSFLILLISSIILSTIIGTVISVAVFKFALSLQLIAGFAVLSGGIYLASDGLLQKRNELGGGRATKLLFGTILIFAGCVSTLASFGTVVLTINDMIDSFCFLWPFAFVAAGVNLLLPTKKVTIFVWISVAAIIVLYALYRNIGGYIINLFR